MNIYDISNAPTADLSTHRIATLGGNQIKYKYDPYKTAILPSVPRKTWRRVTLKLIREKTKRLRRLITTALSV